MVKRSILRTGRAGRGRIILLLALIILVLFLGHRFLAGLPGDDEGTNFLLMEEEDSISLIDNRGSIFDRNFKELAVSLDRVSVYASVRDVDPEAVADQLSPILDVEPQTLKSMLESESYRVWLAKNISKEEEEAIVTLDLGGVYLNKRRARYYPNNKIAAHVLGYIGKSMGLAGVEHRYNTLLNNFGAEENRLEEKQENDASEVPQNISRLTGKKKHLVLTIDLKIQRILEKFVADQWRREGGGKFAAILMECSSGKIISSANYPSFDPNNFQEYSQDEIQNILAQPILVPPLIRRLLWDASLLQTQTEREKEFLPWSLHSTKRRLGSQLQLWDRLGLNDPVEVDFINVVSQISNRRLWPVKQEDDYDSVVEVTTPLHILMAVNGLINGGQQRIPSVIDRMVDRRGASTFVSTPKGVKAIDPKVSDEVLKLLKNQMVEGPVSSGILFSESLSFTENQFIREYSSDKMLFSFIPKKNPKLLLFVFANPLSYNPPPVKAKSKFGLVGEVQQIILRIVTLQEVMTNLSDMMSLEEKREMNFELPQESRDSIFFNSKEPAEKFSVMPDVRGFSLRKSLRLLNDLKLKIRISGSGVVVEQSLEVGVRVKQGTLCRLVLKPH